MQAPTGVPKLVAPVEVQISTEQELQERLVRETRVAGAVPQVDGLVEVEVEPLAMAYPLLAIMWVVGVETAFNSLSEASPTTQQLEVVERANREEERLAPTPPEEDQEEVALTVEVMAFHGVAVEEQAVSTIAPESGDTRVAMAEVELCLSVM